MNYGLNLLAKFWGRRDLIFLLSRREIDLRYKGAGLGVAWAVISLLMQFLIYIFVFGFIFQVRWSGGADTDLADYALILFTGLVCFSVFSETISRVGSSIISAPYLVKKILFPVELLPIASLLSALFHAGVGLILIIGAVLIKGEVIPWTIILLPFVLLPLLFFTLGLAWLFAAIGVFIKDTQFLSALLVQLLFYATPIIYPLALVPENFRDILLFNPLTHIVEMFRQVVLLGQIPMISTWLSLLLACLLVSVVGYYLFNRMKPEFADVI